MHFNYSPVYTMLAEDDLNIMLNVSDAAGNWATDTVNITVLDTESPRAFAGEDIILQQTQNMLAIMQHKVLLNSRGLCQFF